MLTGSPNSTSIGGMICTACQQDKDEESFPIYADRKGARRRRPRCKQCVSARRVQRVAEIPEVALRRRMAIIKYKYGLDVFNYNKLLLDQESLCGICRLPLDNNIVVDHDHMSGAVRGLLHQKCNMAIGLFGDSVDKLKAAIKYLKQKPPVLELPGKTLPMLGTKRPDLAARNRSNKGKPGRKQSEEEKRKRRKPNPKVAIANRGRKHRLETRRLMRKVIRRKK